MKLWIKIVIGIAVVLAVFTGIVLYLSQFHLDFSQDYRNIDGYERIVFKDSWSNRCFHLCAWGLVKTDDPAGFEDHRNPDKTSNEYRFLVEKANVREGDIWQIVPSPDGRYILYAVKIYSGSGLTDDENVFYKVYSIEDGTAITVYSGYRQYFLVDWK